MLPDDDPLAEFDDDVELDVLEPDPDPEPEAPPPPARPRRRLMGETIDSLGARATARPASIDPVRLAEQREHADKAAALLKGGVNKGEQKGFGAASGLKEPPPPA